MKRVIFRDLLLVIFLLVMLACVQTNEICASEEKYPSRPIDVVIGYPPGGVTDLNARLLGKYLEKYLKVPVNVLNKPGAGGIVTTTYVVNSNPDGYTIGNIWDHILLSILLGRATYSLEDLHVICQFLVINNVLAVSTDSQWKTFQEFIDYARKNPGVRYAHPAVGSVSQIKVENLNRIANLKMVGVPFQGDAGAIAAVLGKHVPIGTFSIPAAKAQADAGKFRILFSFQSPAEIGLDPTIPDFVTVFGKDVQDVDIAAFVMVPKKTPKEIIQVLERTMEKISKDPEWAIEHKKNYQIPKFIDGKTVMEKTLPQKMAKFKEILQALDLVK
jgi:tripartite-type tricarboxylate transporter receptor subunit TctC